MIEKLFSFEAQNLSYNPDLLAKYTKCTLRSNFTGGWQIGEIIPFILIDYETGICDFLSENYTVIRTFNLELKVR